MNDDVILRKNKIVKYIFLISYDKENTFTNLINNIIFYYN